jgi:hypothetical protein
MDAQCVIYTGNNIVCGQDTVVTTNDNVAEAIENIVDYFCGGESASVTLTDAGTGTHESLVNDGTGPTLATKGLKAGNAVSLSSTGTDITITNGAPNVDQNIWATIAATTGSTTANTTTDTLTVVGAGGVTTSISGDTLTITGSGGGSNPFIYEIGQYVSSEGGVIAHRWLSNGPSYPVTSGTEQCYLVVDTQSLTNSAQWASSLVNTNSVDSTYFGFANTAILIILGAPYGITAGTAAVLCDNSTNNGKNDWFLPAIDELSVIWQNRWAINQGLQLVPAGPLSFPFYWSSTEATTGVAWTFDFTTGTASLSKLKTDVGVSVRAIRAFSI